MDAPRDYGTVIRDAAVPETIARQFEKSASFQGKTVPEVLADAIIARVNDGGIEDLPEVKLRRLEDIRHYEIKLPGEIDDRFAETAAKLKRGINGLIIDIASDLANRMEKPAKNGIGRA